MSGAKVRLAITASCFCAWLAWLAFLSINYSRSVIVSRSQMMFATQAVRAKITVENGSPSQMELIDFLGKTAKGDSKAEGEKIEAGDLKLVLLPFQKPLTETGIYLVPIRQDIRGRYFLVAPPSSFDRDGESGRFLIYPDTPNVEKQIRDLLPEMGK